MMAKMRRTTSEARAGCWQPVRQGDRPGPDRPRMLAACATGRQARPRPAPTLAACATGRHARPRPAPTHLHQRGRALVDGLQHRNDARGAARHPRDAAHGDGPDEDGARGEARGGVQGGVEAGVGVGARAVDGHAAGGHRARQAPAQGQPRAARRAVARQRHPQLAPRAVHKVQRHALAAKQGVGGIHDLAHESLWGGRGRVCVGG